MPLPKHYLTSTKNVSAIFDAIQAAQAPAKFNRSFLEDLGFKASADRLVINILKALGFLASDGTPTERYFAYLDQTQAGRVLADSIRDAYSDLFQLNRNAETMTKAELKGKIKTLTRGKVSDAVVGKMVNTFQELAKNAEWSEIGPIQDDDPQGDQDGVSQGDADGAALAGVPEAGVLTPKLPISGLVYNIQIQLPESRDQAVYDALFKSLRAHLTQ